MFLVIFRFYKKWW